MATFHEESGQNGMFLGPFPGGFREFPQPCDDGFQFGGNGFAQRDQYVGKGAGGGLPEVVQGIELDIDAIFKGGLIGHFLLDFPVTGQSFADHDGDGLFGFGIVSKDFCDDAFPSLGIEAFQFGKLGKQIFQSAKFALAVREVQLAVFSHQFVGGVHFFLVHGQLENLAEGVAGLSANQSALVGHDQQGRQCF